MFKWKYWWETMKRNTLRKWQQHVLFSNNKNLVSFLLFNHSYHCSIWSSMQSFDFMEDRFFLFVFFFVHLGLCLVNNRCRIIDTLFRHDYNHITILCLHYWYFVNAELKEPETGWNWPRKTTIDKSKRKICTYKNTHTTRIKKIKFL